MNNMFFISKQTFEQLESFMNALSLQTDNVFVSENNALSINASCDGCSGSCAGSCSGSCAGTTSGPGCYIQ